MNVTNYLKELTILNVVTLILGIVIGASFVLANNVLEGLGKLLTTAILVISLGTYYFLFTIYAKRLTLIKQSFVSRKSESAE